MGLEWYLSRLQCMSYEIIKCLAISRQGLKLGSSKARLWLRALAPTSERIKELWVALRLYGEWWSYTIGIGTWQREKARIN